MLSKAVYDKLDELKELLKQEDAAEQASGGENRTKFTAAVVMLAHYDCNPPSKISSDSERYLTYLHLPGDVNMRNRQIADAFREIGREWGFIDNQLNPRYAVDEEFANQV